MTRGREQRVESPFTWKDRSLRSYGDIRREMVEINDHQDDKEAVEFMTALRQRFGVNAEVTAFQISALNETPEAMAGMLTRFLQTDCTGDFHIIEAPEDEHGNTADKPCVRRVRIIDGQGRPRLQVLAPEEIAKSWPTLSPIAWRYFVVDGPARMLPRDEWTNLVGFKTPGTES